VVLISLSKRGNNKPSNVVIRGIDKNSLKLRPQIKLIAGRLPRPGSLEIIGGENIVKRFQGAGMGESLFLGLIGGITGLLMASLLQLASISTTNFQTFAELAFSFHLTFEIVYKSIAFSLIMGFAGGLLPALRASRMNIIEALRAS
jgi:hypothetical protein